MGYFRGGSLVLETSVPVGQPFTEETTDSGVNIILLWFVLRSFQYLGSYTIEWGMMMNDELEWKCS
jgi:hypothetical protein